VCLSLDDTPNYFFSPNLRHKQKEVFSVTRCKYIVNKHQNLTTQSTKYEICESYGFIYSSFCFVMYVSHLIDG
jgi:hypothetical protein